MRRRRQYAANGLAGCVEQRRTRATGTLVGIYDAAASGIEMDPTTPWVTMCEEHNTLVCHPTLRLARANAPDPRQWCELCASKGEGA